MCRQILLWSAPAATGSSHCRVRGYVDCCCDVGHRSKRIRPKLGDAAGRARPSPPIGSLLKRGVRLRLTLLAADIPYSRGRQLRLRHCSFGRPRETVGPTVLCLKLDAGADAAGPARDQGGQCLLGRRSWALELGRPRPRLPLETLRSLTPGQRLHLERDRPSPKRCARSDAE